MITPDIRELLKRSQVDTMRIALYFELPSVGECTIKIIHPMSDRFKPVDVSKALRYCGVGTDQMLQWALAICLELYSVSDAIRYHKQFCTKYLKTIRPPEIPAGANVTKTVFHREMYVPLNP